MRALPMMTKRALLSLALGAAAAAVLPAGAALADQRCRDVRITINNNTSQSIRVYRIEYEDIEDAKFRTENIPNQVIPVNMQYYVVKNLEYVGNEPIGRVRVQYRSGLGTLRAWTPYQASGIGRCVRHQVLTIDVG